jgi:4'-phosphopantetheinyl transferase
MLLNLSSREHPVAIISGDRIPAPESGEIHVWLFSTTEECPNHLESILSPDETSRLSGFVDQSARKTFLLSRVGLRILLGRYLGVCPENVELDYGAYGKPYFVQALEALPVDFNLSHTQGLIAIAVSANPIGIDIERIDPSLDVERLQGYVLTEAEARKITRSEMAARTMEFFRCWTRKEAILKLWGQGITQPLTTLETGEMSLFSDQELLTCSPCDDYIISIASSSPVAVTHIWWADLCSSSTCDATHFPIWARATSASSGYRMI